MSNTAEWLRLAASTLARLTAEAAIVMPPSPTRSLLKHVEAVPLSERRGLLVAVLDRGAGPQQVVGPSEPVTAQHLPRPSPPATATPGHRDAALLGASMGAGNGAR